MGSVDDLDWDDLRFLLAAARHRSLAAAARALGVEHTTIGRRLSALERSLGAAVVLRGPEGLVLTPFGASLLPLVEEVERTVEAVRTRARDRRTRVRLAAPTGFTRMFAEALPRLSKAHPEIELEIQSGARPVDLAKGEADLALRSGPVRGDDLVARKLCEVGFAAYASEAYRARHPGPIEPERLQGHELIGFAESLAATPPAKWIEERAADNAVVLRSREVIEMCSAAVSGVGIAVLPCLMGDAEPALKRVTPEPIATRELSVVYRREARLSPEVQAVLRFTKEVVLENVARLSGR